MGRGAGRLLLAVGDGAPAAVVVVADAGVPAGRPRRRRLLRPLGLPHLPPARPRARGERRDRPRLLPAPPLAAHLPRVRARARPQLRVAAAVPAVGLGQPPLRQQPRRPAGRRPGHLVPRPLVVDRARDAILRALAAARRRDGARAAAVARARPATLPRGGEPAAPRRPRLTYTDAASSWVPADPALIYDKLYTRCAPYLFGMAAAYLHARAPPAAEPSTPPPPSPATTPVAAAVAAAAAAAWFFGGARRRAGDRLRGERQRLRSPPACTAQPGPRALRARRPRRRRRDAPPLDAPRPRAAPRARALVPRLAAVRAPLLLGVPLPGAHRPASAAPRPAPASHRAPPRPLRSSTR